MAESSSSRSSGIGILGLLGVLFVGLKLTGFIDWSWWWVTAPFWGWLVILLAVMAIALIALIGTRLISRR